MGKYRKLSHVFEQEYPTIYLVKYLFGWEILLAGIFTEKNKYENFFFVLFQEIKSIECNGYTKLTKF